MDKSSLISHSECGPFGEWKVDKTAIPLRDQKLKSKCNSHLCFGRRSYLFRNKSRASGDGQLPRDMFSYSYSIICSGTYFQVVIHIAYKVLFDNTGSIYVIYSLGYIWPMLKNKALILALKVFGCIMCMPSHISPIQLFVTLWTVAHQAPLSLGFSRQEYWSRLPFPSSGDLPHPGIEPVSHISSTRRQALYC